MARPIWNGMISFGLLNVPVTLHAAEKRVDLHFRMIDSRTNKPIRYERVNAETGEEVPWKNIVQAFEYEKGNYVVLSKDEISAIAPEGKETIEVETFVDRTSIPITYFEKPYYLLPGKKAEKGYVLLREVLAKENKVGIGHVIIRTRRYLCAIVPLENMLILNLLRFQQEIVDAENFEFPEADLKKLRISSSELDMAAKLIESMTVPWNPADYVDDYRQRLSELVEKRMANSANLIHEEEGEEPATGETATNVVDFMALLKKSLEGGSREPAAAKRTNKNGENQGSNEKIPKSKKAVPAKSKAGPTGKPQSNAKAKPELKPKSKPKAGARRAAK